MAKVLCYSEREFKELMKKNGWLEEKDLPENVAIISIIGGDDCIKGFFEVRGEEISHWFKNSNDQILNLEFDDVTEEVYIQGYRIYPISMDQAKEAVKFIEKNVGKDFYITATPGMLIAVYDNEDGELVEVSAFNLYSGGIKEKIQ